MVICMAGEKKEVRKVLEEIWAKMPVGWYDPAEIERERQEEVRIELAREVFLMHGEKMRDAFMTGGETALRDALKNRQVPEVSVLEQAELDAAILAKMGLS